MTTTGEIMQLIRLHYEVEEVDQLRPSSPRCAVWNMTPARRDGSGCIPTRATIKDRRAANNVVLGKFVFKSAQDVVLNSAVV